MNTITIGDKCPSFSHLNQHGEEVNFNDLVGKKIMVIYFYPKDNTPGCTKQACSFRDNHDEFLNLNCEVIGISSDDMDSHNAFSHKFHLPFHLLADTKKELRNAFGVPSNLFGLIPGRVTYIIDLNGIVQGIFNSQTHPFDHITHALEKAKAMIN